MKKFLLFALRFYMENISPAFPARCRYYPTCSKYTLEAVEIYGPIKGFFMGLVRILRCNPLFKGGYDPVLKFDRDKKFN